MKLLFIIPLVIAFLSIIGMFYWMYKSRNGELNLSKNPWHLKLLYYMWDVELYQLKNACPYYCSIVLSLILLTPYLVIRYLIVAPCKWVGNWKIFNYSVNRPKIKFLDKLFTIPDSKKQWFSLIYKYGKTILLWAFGIVLGIIAIGSIIAIFVFPWLKLTFTLALIVTGVILFVLTTILIHLLLPTWDEYHITHYQNFCSGFIGILSIPFVVTYKLLSFLFKPLFQVISDSCPPISWS